MVAPGAPEDPLAHFTAEEAASFVRLLILIRDNYTKADKAAHFLERKADIANTCSIANLRDVLSHMATLLDPSTSPADRLEQQANAEEHLRRAIIEPYEIALAALTQKFTLVYDGYREKVIPKKDSTEGFHTAPTRFDIEDRLRAINDLAEKAKQAKGRNRWDADWESGVSALIDSYNKLYDLYGEIEDWLFKHNQHVSQMQINQVQVQAAQTAQHHTRLHRWGIGWAIGGIAIGLIGGYLFTRYSGLISLPSPPATTDPQINVPGTTAPR
jgi:hypothetical protein